MSPEPGKTVLRSHRVTPGQRKQKRRPTTRGAETRAGPRGRGPLHLRRGLWGRYEREHDALTDVVTAYLEILGAARNPT